MTHTLEVSDDRHSRFPLYPLDQMLAATRYDHIDAVGHLSQHVTHGRAIAGGTHLDTTLRQFSFGQSLLQHRVNRRTGAAVFRPAPPNHRIAGLETQPTRIGRDVGPALVNDA